MKRFIALTLAALFCAIPLISLSACSQQTETLTVCNWGEYISDGTDGYMDVIAEFEERFHVKVDYVLAETNETLYSMMKSGGGDYDVIIPSDYMIARMIQEGMLAKLDYNNIPNFETNIMPQFKNLYYDAKNEYSVPYFWGTVGLLYNEELYTEEVTGWDNLWCDGYKNQVLMFDNPRDAFAVALQKLGYSINSENEAEWREAADLLKSKKFDYCMDEFFDKMPGESAVLCAYYAGDCYSVMQENESLRFFRPEHTNVFNDAMCVPATSAHKELAEKFINFMLEKDVGLANTEYLGYSTPNKLVFDALPEEMKENDDLYPEIKDTWEYMHLLPENIENLMNELWLEIKAENK